MAPNLNLNPAKIKVIKFDEIINFDMQRCEVFDALVALNLNDTVELQTKPICINDIVLTQKRKMACAIIRSCLTQDIKYYMMAKTVTKKLW